MNSAGNAKKLLKLPKEMPSNIIIKSDNIKLSGPSDQYGVSNERGGGAQQIGRPQSSSHQNRTRQQVDFNPDQQLPSFKEVDNSRWQQLFIAKLKYCYKIADFSESKKDTELKEKKKETMIEIIDALDDSEAVNYLYNDTVLHESIKMIEANIFRTFGNKSKSFSTV